MSACVDTWVSHMRILGASHAISIPVLTHHVHMRTIYWLLLLIMHRLWIGWRVRAMSLLGHCMKGVSLWLALIVRRFVLTVGRKSYASIEIDLIHLPLEGVNYTRLRKLDVKWHEVSGGWVQALSMASTGYVSAIVLGR